MAHLDYAMRLACFSSSSARPWNGCFIYFGLFWILLRGLAFAQDAEMPMALREPAPLGPSFLRGMVGYRALDGAFGTATAWVSLRRGVFWLEVGAASTGSELIPQDPAAQGTRENVKGFGADITPTLASRNFTLSLPLRMKWEGRDRETAFGFYGGVEAALWWNAWAITAAFPRLMDEAGALSTPPSFTAWVRFHTGEVRDRYSSSRFTLALGGALETQATLLAAVGWKGTLGPSGHRVALWVDARLPAENPFGALFGFRIGLTIRGRWNVEIFGREWVRGWWESGVALGHEIGWP